MTNRYYKAACIATVAIGCASPALAEVMDKEPTVTAIWLSATVATTIGLLACWRHPVLGILTLYATAGLAPAGIAFFDIHNPILGPDILYEAGQGYLNSANSAMALMISAHLVGILLYARTSRLRRLRNRA